jgi:hypothetical protein
MAKNKRDKSKSNAINATSKESLYPPIDQAQKEWLLQKFAEEFNGCVGKQGKVKNSAMEYVREVIIKQFYELWYPNSTSSQREEMLAYYEDVSVLSITGKEDVLTGLENLSRAEQPPPTKQGESPAPRRASCSDLCLGQCKPRD